MKLLTDIRFWVAVGIACLAIFFWLGSGLITTGEPPTTLPLTYRILLLVFLLFAAGSLAFALQLNARRTNANVLKEISSSTDAGAGADAGSMLSEEERQLREKFNEAAAFLKTKRFGKAGGKRHLYQLPWYVVLGSPGSGKTTAVRNSGLDFPLDDITSGNSLGGVGGTRNCDWWITDQAVLLDTAGRYTTQDSDASYDARGWQNFLDLLRKNRKQQPINGAVLVVGTDELLKMSDAEWQQYTRTVTARLRELTTQLQMDFPVYVLVTKVDLLAGCREFFDALDVEEQQQIWGTTLPLGSAPEALDRELEALNARLHSQLPSKLRYERDTRRRQAIYSFPWQMENVTSRLQGFVHEVFSRQGVNEHAQFRGLYLTSAVQEGSPIERLFAGVTSGFGISGSLASGQQQSRSLFLKRLFPEVIFREAFLAGSNTAHDRRLRHLRMAALAGIVLLGAGLAFAWTSAFTIHRNLLNEAQEQLTAFAAAPKGAEESLNQNLLSLQYLEGAAGVFDQQDHPWLSNLGMYDSSVDEAAKGAYLRSLQTVVAPALGAEMDAWLAAGDSADYLENFNTLKAYLMLGDHQRRDPDWLLQWMQAAPVPRVSEAIEANVQRHMAWLFSEDPDYQLPEMNATTIKRTRTMLTKVADGEAVYSRMKHLYAGETTDLLPQMGPYFANVFESSNPAGLLIPTLYTVAGYRTLDFGIDSEAVGGWLSDRWVLEREGIPNPLQIAETAGAVKPLYARDYATTWREFLGAIELLPVAADAEMLTDTLGYLGDNSLSPMSSLARLVAVETTLPGADENVAAAAAAAGKLAARKTGKLGAAAGRLASGLELPEQVDIPEQVASAFSEHQALVQGGAASRDAKLSAQLGDLGEWLYAVRNTPGEPAGPDPSGKLLMAARNLPSPYASWVTTLAQSAKTSASRQKVGRLNASWQRQVAAVCQRSFSSRFPFSGGADTDTTLRDFEAFFGPGAVEQSFVEESLRPVMKRGDGTLSEGTLWSIRQAERIREAFFPDGNNLGFRYQLTAVDVDDRIGELVIESGRDQRVRYRHGPPVPLELDWPDGEDGIRITFNRKDGSIQRQVISGPWAIFRAVEAGRQTGANRYASADSLLVTFSDGEYRATFRLTSDSPINPFQAGLLDKYRCRANL
jgi:type VI secretion system protein ImpL